MRFVFFVAFAILLGLAAGAAVEQKQSVGSDAASGLWERFQNFFRTVWLPFVEERLIKMKPPPPIAEKVSRSVDVEDSVNSDEDRELKFKKLNFPATRYTENAVYSLRGGVAWGPFQPRVAVVQLTGVVDTGAAALPVGTLRLFQPTIFSDVSVTGVIRNLVAHESINIHVRNRGDITANCANQGDLYNPTSSTTGFGGNIGTFTAAANGVATIDVPKINPVYVDLFENSIYGRSIRVSRATNAGLPRLCGIVGFP